MRFQLSLPPPPASRKASGQLSSDHSTMSEVTQKISCCNHSVPPKADEAWFRAFSRSSTTDVRSFSRGSRTTFNALCFRTRKLIVAYSVLFCDDIAPSTRALASNSAASVAGAYRAKGNPLLKARTRRRNREKGSTGVPRIVQAMSENIHFFFLHI